jgi:hypothetical protein
MKIAILSKGADNYSTKRLREEAEARGHEVSVINYAKCYVTLESSNPVVRYQGEVLEGFDVIIPRHSAASSGWCWHPEDSICPRNRRPRRCYRSSWRCAADYQGSSRYARQRRGAG